MLTFSSVTAAPPERPAIFLPGQTRPGVVPAPMEPGARIRSDWPWVAGPPEKPQRFITPVKPLPLLRAVIFTVSPAWTSSSANKMRPGSSSSVAWVSVKTRFPSVIFALASWACWALAMLCIFFLPKAICTCVLSFSCDTVRTTALPPTYSLVTTKRVPFSVQTWRMSFFCASTVFTMFSLYRDELVLNLNTYTSR